jgi:hypothetical protein
VFCLLHRPSYIVTWTRRNPFLLLILTFIAKTPVQSRVTSSEIRFGWSGTRSGFSQSFSVLPCWSSIQHCSIHRHLSMRSAIALSKQHIIIPSVLTLRASFLNRHLAGLGVKNFITDFHQSWVPGSNLGPESCYPAWVSLWFPSVPPRKFRDSTLN